MIHVPVSRRRMVRRRAAMSVRTRLISMHDVMDLQTYLLPRARRQTIRSASIARVDRPAIYSGMNFSVMLVKVYGKRYLCSLLSVAVLNGDKCYFSTVGL